MNTPVRHGRLDEGVPEHLPDELVTVLASGPGVRVERIVSRGHVTPLGEWYDQTEDELVVLLQGGARLEFEEFELELSAGDWIDIPAGVRHRVAWTTPDEDAVWLAVFRAASTGSTGSHARVPNVPR